MGCDIHGYVEFAKKQTAEEKKAKEKRMWQSMGGKFYLGRDYYMFGTLSKGVRIDLEHSYKAKGFPEDMSFMATVDNQLYVIDDGDDYEDGTCTMTNAEKWVKNNWSKVISENDGKPSIVTNPDWHSHNWLTTQQLKSAFDKYDKNVKKHEGKDAGWYKVGATYKAILAAMETYEEEGLDARFVFWFDN